MLKETFILSEELEHLEKISVECDIQIDQKKQIFFLLFKIETKMKGRRILILWGYILDISFNLILHLQFFCIIIVNFWWNFWKYYYFLSLSRRYWSVLFSLRVYRICKCFQITVKYWIIIFKLMLFKRIYRIRYDLHATLIKVLSDFVLKGALLQWIEE